MTTIQKIEEKRSGIFVGALALAAGAALVVALTPLASTANASLTVVETSEETSQDWAELIAGVPFDEGYGVITKDISPGQPTESFSVLATNVGNVAGNVAIGPANYDISNFSDGFLDQTQVQVTIYQKSGPGGVTETFSLREFATNGFVATPASGAEDFVVDPGQQVRWEITYIPAATSAGFDSDDLGSFTNSFQLQTLFSGLDETGSSDLLRGLEADGSTRGSISYMPWAQLVSASENGVAAVTP